MSKVRLILCKLLKKMNGIHLDYSALNKFLKSFQLLSNAADTLALGSLLDQIEIWTSAGAGGIVQIVFLLSFPWAVITFLSALAPCVPK